MTVPLRPTEEGSRGYVEDRRLPQTPQYSDDADKQLGIWSDVFTDGVDIHARGSIRNYGPVQAAFLTGTGQSHPCIEIWP